VDASAAAADGWSGAAGAGVDLLAVDIDSFEESFVAGAYTRPLFDSR
jgi:hypothetical protein